MACPYKVSTFIKNESKCPILVSPDVAFAMAYNKLIVALESTIISHGMPYPQNVATAKEVEATVKENGAVPATIAILDGVIRIGLDNEALEKLGKLGPNVIKCSRRDIAYVVSQKKNGATTVSATMLIANMVGIRIFVTGGIGGVHREGENTMDISADLTELGRTPVAVVCAGAKSILDLGRTLEFLETQGVCVVGYDTDEFPAFFTPHSGCPTSCRVNTPEECANLLKSNHELKIGSGILINCPIPEKYAAEAAKVETAIQQSLNEMKVKNIIGKDITPYLLKRINEITGGESLKSNIALIKNNATIGAKIAVALASLAPIIYYNPHTTSSSTIPPHSKL